MIADKLTASLSMQRKNVTLALCSPRHVSSAAELQKAFGADARPPPQPQISRPSADNFPTTDVTEAALCTLNRRSNLMAEHFFILPTQFSPKSVEVRFAFNTGASLLRGNLSLSLPQPPSHCMALTKYMPSGKLSKGYSC
jgi:hypothetical protein